MPTPKFANLQAILAEESEPETGVVSENAEERLEAEMRRVLIDFFERFFLWCALFRPVRGSRGMRGETELTRFGKVRGLIPGCDFFKCLIVQKGRMDVTRKNRTRQRPSPPHQIDSGVVV